LSESALEPIPLKKVSARIGEYRSRRIVDWAGGVLQL
jgi:hypothetical protein